MTAAPDLRRGWCPGALRPMETGDGLLVRLRLTGGAISAAPARAVAEGARRFGSGLLDLSARGNLQLRGVTDATLPALTERLAELGLLDADPAGEAVRNVVASPLAGLDPTALLDVRPLLRALETRLVRDTALHALPGKFGFVLDDGGVLPLGSIEADIRFAAMPGPQGPLFCVRVGGDGAGLLLGAVQPERLVETAAALARMFLAWRGEGADAPRRMAGLVQRLGGSVMQAAANLPGLPARSRAPAGAHAPAVAGWWSAGALGVLGVGAPFGRWSADDIDLLAGLAEDFGTGDLRLTPWRTILLPGVAGSAAGPLEERLGGRFILAADDPRAAVAACPGRPACGNATTPVPQDALRWASLARRLAPEGIGLHVSGCPKGCAHPGPLPVTLVAREGRYDIVLSGTARSEPFRTGLGAAEVSAELARLAEAAP
jgi:precorrin-3B synthase